MTTVAYKVLDRLLLPAFWLSNRRPRIFMFHSVGRTPVTLSTGEQGPQIRPELFEAFIDWLAAHATIITVSELVRSRARAHPTSGRLSALSLDDGYEDNYSVAFPILKSRGVPATIFLTTAMIREQDEAAGCGLSRSQIKEMHNAGVEFGAHTMTHPRLTRIAAARARQEIMDSKLAVEGITGSPCRGFCYPYGAVDSNIADMVRQCGFSYGVTTQDRFFQGQDDFLVPRTVLPASPNTTDFAVRLSGAHAWRQSAYLARKRIRPS